MTQIYFRWRPPTPGYYVPNASGSDSDESHDFVSDVDEDVIDFSVVSATLSFSWVEDDDDERNYALFHHREFYEESLRLEATLCDRIATVEASILGALGDDRLRSSTGVRTAVETSLAALRVEVATLCREQRYNFR